MKATQLRDFQGSHSYRVGTFIDRVIDWFDFFHFLPNKDKRINGNKDKMLCIELTKVVFGTCFQFGFQLILYFGYTKQGEVEYSQIFSKVTSLFVICKVGVSIVRFKRRTQEDNTILQDGQESSWQKINRFCRNLRIQNLWEIRITLYICVDTPDCMNNCLFCVNIGSLKNTIFEKQAS